MTFRREGMVYLLVRREGMVYLLVHREGMVYLLVHREALLYLLVTLLEDSNFHTFLNLSSKLS